MKLLEFIKSESEGWGKYERIIFPLGILLIIAISIYMNDSKIALVSAVCGIGYTILSGKGKISCYFIGLIGTMCYAYLAYKNALYGNLLLYACYYFPMQILGIFKWRQHLNKESHSIVKTHLSIRSKIAYFSVATVLSAIVAVVLYKIGDATPVIDSITTVFSVIGLLLTVKRCVEQWYIWAVVNGLSVLMWIEAYINGSNCFATVLMWAAYFFLSFYFLHQWNRELKESN